MEQVITNEQGHPIHFEVIVTFLAVFLFAFSMYHTVFSQTGGTTGVTDYVRNPNNGMDVSKSTGTTTSAALYPYNTTGQVIDYAAYTTTSGTTSPWSRRGRSGTTSTTTTGSQNTGGNGSVTGGTTTGGTGYYGTTAGGYNTNGMIDQDPTRTQGTYLKGGGYGSYNTAGINDTRAVPSFGNYVQTKGNGYYNGQGFMESGVVKTQGVMIQSNNSSALNPKSFNDQSLSAPTQSTTVSMKNCEFITKYHRFGDRGGDVPKIQKFLKDRGYYNGKIDGVYGINTFKAVQVFQKDNKNKILDPWDFDNKAAVQGTGITNISTKYAINKMVGCPDPVTIIPTTGNVLNY